MSACSTPPCVLSMSALALAKQQIGPLPTTSSRRIALLLIDGDWRQAPAIKARLVGHGRRRQ
jgi:hypothetical protein